jgi:hypothetical protein
MGFWGTLWYSILRQTQMNTGEQIERKNRRPSVQPASSWILNHSALLCLKCSWPFPTIWRDAGVSGYTAANLQKMIEHIEMDTLFIYLLLGHDKPKVTRTDWAAQVKPSNSCFHLFGPSHPGKWHPKVMEKGQHGNPPFMQFDLNMIHQYYLWTCGFSVAIFDSGTLGHVNICQPQVGTQRQWELHL